MLCTRGLCRHAVSVCLSVCVSVTLVHSVKMNKHIFQFFHRRVATSFYLSRVSTLTRDIDIAIMFVCPSAVCPPVCLSVHNVPVLDENGLTYCHSFFHHTVAQSL